MNIKDIIKTQLLLLFTITAGVSYAQTLDVKSGTSIYIGDGTVLSLDKISLNVDGEFVADEGSEVVMSSSGEELSISGSKDVSVWNLRMNTDAVLNTNLTVNGDIDLESGIFDLFENDLRLEGSILNEREQSRIFATGAGEIIKKFSLSAGNSVNPGNIGLEFSSATDITDQEIRRGHEINTNGDNSSIERYFSFPVNPKLSTLKFNYFDAELNSIDATLLELWGSSAGTWEILSNNGGNQPSKYFQFLDISNSDHNIFTLFPFSETRLTQDVSIPSGFSPNGDGINDYFVIEGLENCPDNKLIIINRWNDIIYKSEPYNNEWDGASTAGIKLFSSSKKIIDGTYFYIFYQDKDSKPIKGYLEVRSDF
jgi:gliding motility-associated-like protein